MKGSFYQIIASKSETGDISNEEGNDDKKTEDVQDVLGDNLDNVKSKITDSKKEVTDNEDDDESTDKEED